MYKVIVFSCLVSFAAFAQTGDPTRPLNASPKATVGVEQGGSQESLQLTSILFSTSRRVAIINGQPLTENQKLAGSNILVKKIESEKVILSQNNRLITLKLSVQDVKKIGRESQKTAIGESSPL